MATYEGIPLPRDYAPLNTETIELQQQIDELCGATDALLAHFYMLHIESENNA